MHIFWRVFPMTFAVTVFILWLLGPVNARFNQDVPVKGCVEAE